MWIKRTLLLLVLISAFSCQNSPEAQYTVNGTLLSDYEGYIYLNYFEYDRDSALVKNGQFSFTGTMPHVVEAGLSTEKGSSVGSFYFGNEVVNLKVGFNGDYFTIEEQESETATFVDSVFTYLSGVLENNPNPNDELHTYMTALISGHSDNQFVSEILIDLITEARYFSFEQSEILIELIDKDAVIREYLKSAVVAINRMENINEGDSFPDFTVTNAAGEIVKPSDFKGKYLLVDLWASWCAPCRKANPMIAQIYKEYKDKGFEVLSISVDTSEKAWVKAVTKDQLTWPNARVEGGLGNPIAQDLGVVFLPYNYLIDPEGNIVKINVDLPTVISVLNSELSSTP